jgi:hypothetical protein
MAAPKTQKRGQKDGDTAAPDAPEQETPQGEATEGNAPKTDADAPANAESTNGASETPKDDAAAKKAAEEAEKESERERKAKEKAEAEQKVRQEKIDAGDLVVSSKQKYEFEAATKETKVFNQVQEIIAKYEDSDEPLVFGEVVKGISAKYPEDLIPAMHALEHLGIVRRFDAKSTSDGAGNRRQTAYLWIGLSDEDDADGAGSEDAGEVQAEQPAAA